MRAIVAMSSKKCGTVKDGEVALKRKIENASWEFRSGKQIPSGKVGIFESSTQKKYQKKKIVRAVW